MGGGEGLRGVLKDALEGRFALLAQLVSALVLGFLFLLFALELLSAFFFGLVLLSALLVLGLALCGFFWGLLGWGSHDGGRVLLLLLGLPGGGARTMDRAVVVGANGEGGAYALAVDDDGGFSCLAWCYRLGVGVIGVFDFAEVAALDGSGPLLLRAAIAVLDLDKLGTGGNLAVNVGLHFGVKARGV